MDIRIESTSVWGSRLVSFKVLERLLMEGKVKPLYKRSITGVETVKYWFVPISRYVVQK
jgi:hypothetical protein